MTITNRESGTNVHEIAEGIFRINTPLAIPGAGGFSFNQYLITDDEPFTQGGSDCPALTESDILGPSEAFRHQMDYFSHTKNAPELLEKLASKNPETLACMHGSAWRGDGAALIRALADSLSA
jgi:hypothetical protein